MIFDLHKYIRNLILALVLALTQSIVLADTLDSDARLNVKWDLKMSQVPVRDVVAEIGLQTGIQFFVEDFAGDDRVTVIAHNRTYADILRNIAMVFGDIWSISGTGKSTAFTLKRSPELERVQIEITRKRAAERLRNSYVEINSYNELARLTESEREALMGILPAAAAKTANLEEKIALELKLSALQQTREAGTRAQWVPVIYRLLENIPNAEKLQLSQKEIVTYSYPYMEGTNKFPTESLDTLKRAIRLTLTPTTNPNVNTPSSVRIRFTQNRGKMNSFRWEITCGQRYGQYISTTRYTGLIPSVQLSDTVTVRSSNNSAFENDPQFSKLVTLHLPANKLKDKFLSNTNPSALLVSDVLIRLDAIQPLNVVADGFWSGRLTGLDINNVTIGDTLTKIAAQSSRSLSYANGFVNLVTTKIAEDRDQEPPSTKIARWRDLADSGTFTIDELSEIAELTEAQSQTLLEMASWGAFPMVYQGLYQAKSHLQFWAGLRASQRRDAQTMGLAFATLTEEQKKQYQFAAGDPTSNQYAALQADSSNISRSSLKVTIQEYPGWYVVRGGAASTYRLQRGVDTENGAVNREEALKRFRQLEPSILPKDVLPMVRSVVIFTYSTKEGTISRTAFELPLRRDSTD